MQKLADRILYSATDLTRFADCKHLTWLDRLNLDSPMERAPDDEHAQLIQAKGHAHEATFLGKLKATHADCVEVDFKAPLEDRIRATRVAMDAGAAMIYQATFARDDLIGHADFLVRVDEPGQPGVYGYEVIDTKLAHSAKAKFIIQLCFYSDLLGSTRGRLPVQMHVELGNGKRESFRVQDYFYYYRHLLDRFGAFLRSYPSAVPPYPTPCDLCSLCHWRNRCDATRATDDHLSAVARITKQQVSRLEAAGTRTMAQLATLPVGGTIPKMADETLAKLRQQAALQVEERETGRQRHVLLPHTPGEQRGLGRLPIPDAGDIFFDMEGDPMEEDGLEYLFGVYFVEQGLPRFQCFWAHDRDEERQAFMDFMDFVTARLTQHPGMHIYHYASYEPTALKRLMSLHGVREAAVDQLLRDGRMVDLYKAVSEGLRISKPSYSIKALEAFYSEKRNAGVTNAMGSIVAYERWRLTRDATILESIRRYNEDDCRSTWQLREWLVTFRPAELPWWSRGLAAITNQKKPARKKSDATIAHEETLEIFYRKLVTHPENPHLDPKLAQLVYYLLDFHRRAEKPVWWALFDHQQAELEDLLEESEVIAGLHSPEDLFGGDRHELIRYRYPEQDFKARAGDRARRLDNLKEVTIKAIDEDALTVDIELHLDELPPESISISLGAPVPATAIKSALFEFAAALVRGAPQYKAVLDYLARRIPDIQGLAPGEPIIGRAPDPLARTIDVATKLNESYLFIQGPPGTGKTYTGSHIIAALLQAGKRIAVSSNSHKAIINLLEAVDKRMKEAGATYKGMKKCSSEEHYVESDFIDNVGSDAPILTHRPQLVAGTAWLFSKPPFREDFDYLFIDEAGQVSLANTIAMGMCAKNLILLGDQMQLGQPIQGVHPGRSGESGLEYLLDGKPTIAPEQGTFLNQSYRMHPDVCRFISDAVYEAKLKAHPSTYGQCLVLNKNAHPLLKATGIRHVPVEHDGCSQRSEAEASLVKDLVDNLLTQQYRNKEDAIRPMTLDDILVVAPYNIQVNLLKRRLQKGSRVGTVDKFQGQEAEVVIVSMTTSSGEYLPRFIDFLFSKNRLNVAISRARCLSLVLATHELFGVIGSTPDEIRLINTLNHFQQSETIKST